tara:strand:- start:24954 stop:25091 length:138 start_codon:yes stop_codon:yes gene_type:complete
MLSEELEMVIMYFGPIKHLEQPLQASPKAGNFSELTAYMMHAGSI